MGFKANLTIVAKVNIPKHDENRTTCCPSHIQSFYWLSDPGLCLTAVRTVTALLGFSRAFHMEPSEKRNAVIVRKLLLLVR
jgi:hypothetical protein